MIPMALAISAIIFFASRISPIDPLNSLISTTNTSGIGNTAYGYAAGDAHRTGSYNTFIGYDAGGSITLSGINCTIIGNGATPSGASAANEITLGNASMTSLRCADQTIATLS